MNNNSGKLTPNSSDPKIKAATQRAMTPSGKGPNPLSKAVKNNTLSDTKLNMDANASKSTTNVETSLKTAMADSKLNTAATSSTPTPTPTAPAPAPTPSPAAPPTNNAVPQTSTLKTEFVAPTHNQIMKAINESSSIIAALEAVGAMYNIPSTSFVCSKNVGSIGIKEDKIYAPVGGIPSANTREIICSIGALLDIISQRINYKLNTLQDKNTKDGRLRDEVTASSNPSKGKVIHYCSDPNGKAIIFYDSGIVDHDNTPEAYACVDQIRKELPDLPEYDINKDHRVYDKPYFDDDYDLMAGIEECRKAEMCKEYCVADEINEDAELFNMFQHYGESYAVGYEALNKAAGFNFVKKTGYYFTEAADDIKSITSKDLKHMKFDNKELMKAVKLFNAARDEQNTVKLGYLDIEKLYKSKNFNNAVKAIENQFDCHLNLRWIKVEEYESNAFTAPDIYENEIKKDITVSKSKGFQLNGQPIDVWLLNRIVEEVAPEEYFGQAMMSLLLHEIFHNIYRIIKGISINMMAPMSVAITLAAAEPNAKARRKTIEAYVKSLDDFFGVKLNIVSRRILIKKLCALSTVKSENDIKKAVEGDTDDTSSSSNSSSDISSDDKKKANEEIDKLIDKYKKENDAIKSHSTLPAAFVIIACSIVIALSIGGIIPGVIFTLGKPLFVMILLVAFMDIASDAFFNAVRAEDHEEEYCDMFAAMYQLPVRWFNDGFGSTNKFTPKYADDEKLIELEKVQKESFKLWNISYPTMMERSYHAVNAAKKMLDSKEALDPSAKKYLEWIVDNYSDLLKEDYDFKGKSDECFDASASDDLDKWLQKLIDAKDSNIGVTEFYNHIDLANDIELYEESLYM